MKLVVDASAVVSLALEEAVERLHRHDVLAPALMWSEAVTAIHLGWQFREMSDELYATAVSQVLAAPVERRFADELYRGALAVASTLGWARTYDAEYVALAQASGAALLTVDRKLARRVESIVDVVDPADVVG